MGWTEFLQGKGWWGRAIVWFIQSAIAPYVTFAAIVSAILSAWAYTRAIVGNPTVQLGAQIFLVLLWTYIGLLFLLDRRRPRISKPYQDYEYGLTFEGLIPQFSPENKEQMLNFGIQLRNYSQGPILYTVKKFEVIVSNRTVPSVEVGKLTAVLSRGSVRVSHNIAFKYDDIKDFIGKQVEGVIDVVIIYGHPDKQPERELTVSHKIVIGLVKTRKVKGSKALPLALAFGGSITSETDKAFKQH